MNIVLTGSLGHITQPLATSLVQQGHVVTIISSNAAKKTAIEQLGATAATGRLEDRGFLTRTFSGADAVYCMEPPVNFFDQALDYISYYNALASAYVQAIRQSGVQRVVHLSSIGAHTDKGNGMLAFHYNVENILQQLPAGVAIRFMRPVGFYYNLFSFIPGIKAMGAIVTNYAGIKEPWVSPIDIAARIAEVIVQPFEGRQYQYIASDELTCDEVAGILGAAIGQPGLPWKAIPDEEFLQRLLKAGMNTRIANDYVAMNAGRVNGLLYEDYYRNRPVLGKVKLADFASEFAAVYNQQ